MNKLNSLIKVAMVATGIAACAAQARAEYTDDCITFSSANSFTLKTSNTSKNWDGTLWTSTDKVNWTEWNGGQVSAAQAAGAYNLYVRGNAANTKITTSASKRWVLTGSDIACTGNIETLRGATGVAPSPTAMASNCYYGMFKTCTSLTVAPTLPATELAGQCYNEMFRGCTSLTAAPALPATELAEFCYMSMFMGCTSLTAAPELPATELAKQCYSSMFSDCTSLTAAPALPATALAESCCQAMFQRCTSLTAAPELPATELAKQCCSFMFSGCTSLTAAPALNATALADSCCLGMFQNCTSLTEAPALPATKLETGCYSAMFSGCTSLKVNEDAPGKEWKIPATTPATDWGNDMFTRTGGNIPSPPALNTPYYIASAPVALDVAKPENATVSSVTTNGAPATVPCTIDYVTPVKVVYTADAGYMFPGGYKTFETNLTANADEITVTLTAGQQPVAAKACADCITFSASEPFGIKMWRQGTPAEPKLECSQDQIYWSKFDLGNGAAAGADNKLYLRGTGNKAISEEDIESYIFTNTVDSAATAIACSGNTLTLLDHETVANGNEPTMGVNAFINLFRGFAALTTAPALPATNLAVKCYAKMFMDCTSLTMPPELPAANLPPSCYWDMFSGCTSLTAAPALPATNLADYCYQTIFKNCSKLTAAPALPAMTLAFECYNGMFSGCTSLTAAPALPAMTLASKCYVGMFRDCTALTDVPALPSTNLAYMCYATMFKGCTALEVNTNGAGKAWSIPSDAAASAKTAENWNAVMFSGTAGDITNTVVTPGVTYYVKSAIKRVTVVVPEVDGATAELFAFDVNGGWRAVETNAVPSNATVRVVWTAADDKVLTGADAVNVYEWQTELVADKALQDAPAPTVGDDGESEVAVRIDTRATKRYFRAEDILPVWAAMGSEVKVKGEGEQSWTDLVKNAANTNTFTWKPTAPDIYTLSHTAFENATIILATPVEVTTNGLEVAGTTVKVTDESCNPLVAQTEGEFAGRIIVPSNSTVKVVWTATGAGKYFMDGTTTYTQTFEADKPVNAVSEAVTVPEEPKEPSVKVGIVGQRYPWDGKLDVQYWAKNTPNKGWRIKVTVTLPDGKEGSETVDALSGVNTMVFDMRKAFGEVTVKGVKVKAELEMEK